MYWWNKMNITLYGISSFHFHRWNRFKIIPLACTLRSLQETPNLLRRPTRVDNTADNADIIKLQAANHHWLLSYVTLGLVECRKQTACIQSPSSRILYWGHSREYSHLVKLIKCKKFRFRFHSLPAALRSAPVFRLLKGTILRFFRSARATRCTDWGEIWRRRVDRCRGEGMGP